MMFDGEMNWNPEKCFHVFTNWDNSNPFILVMIIFYWKISQNSYIHPCI